MNSDGTQGRSVVSVSADERIIAIRTFFETFGRDWTKFERLWANNPIVEIPFAPPGTQNLYSTKETFLGFWHPIFFDMRGKFDWTIEDLIIEEGGERIVALTKSDVHVSFSFGPIQYAGNYLQIFHFEEGKIKKFTEYVDTYFMNRVYGKSLS